MWGWIDSAASWVAENRNAIISTVAAVAVGIAVAAVIVGTCGAAGPLALAAVGAVSEMAAGAVGSEVSRRLDGRPFDAREFAKAVVVSGVAGMLTGGIGGRLTGLVGKGVDKAAQVARVELSAGARVVATKAVQTTANGVVGGGVGAATQVADNVVENEIQGERWDHDLGRGVKRAFGFGMAAGIAQGPLAKTLGEPIARTSARLAGRPTPPSSSSVPESEPSSESASPSIGKTPPAGSDVVTPPATAPPRVGVVKVLADLEACNGTSGGEGSSEAVAPTEPAPSSPGDLAPPSQPAEPASAAKSTDTLGALGEEPRASEPAPRPSYSQESTRAHLFQGETVTDPRSPYFGKWDGKGLHDWSGLQQRVAKDGFKIAGVTEDPATGARRVTVERTGVKPAKLGPDGKPANGKAPEVVRGKVSKTVYPSSMSHADIEAAGDLALQKAIDGEAGTKLTPPDATKAGGANGTFEATVPGPKGPLRVQGWYKQLPDGTKVIVSHAPAFDAWPAVPPEEW